MSPNLQRLAAGTLAMLAVFPTGARAGDAARGKQLYESRCIACHSIDENRTGPRHCGLFGRRAGSVKGFAYSGAMKRSKTVWSGKTLDRFIENPLKAIPGTAMGYAGVSDKKERADLIAYLEQANNSPACRKLFPIPSMTRRIGRLRQATDKEALWRD